MSENDGDMNIASEPTNDWVDITAVFKNATSALTVTDSMLCNKESFNLQDSMAALELMDPKMDCCEIPASQVAPLGTKTTEQDELRMVFPRPAPTGLDDVVDPLPWNELTIQDAAWIALDCLVRLESLLGGASVVESTFTCLYAHRPVVEDMKSRLGPVTLTEQMQAIMKPNDNKGTPAQHIVYASILMLLELTDVIRGIILNADIYEEEDFTVSTYGIEVFDDRDEATASNVTKSVLQNLSVLTNPQSDEVQAIIQILGFQLDLLAICSSMGRLAGKSVVKQVEQSQKTSRSASSKLDQLVVIVDRMQKYESDTIKALRRKAFDSFVNRPLVGNSPVRKILFHGLGESITSLTTITKEIDWALCRIMLKGNTIGRIRRMISHLSVSSVNILTRSLLVLNLYFDDKLFGQHSFPQKIIQHMQQLSYIPDEAFQHITAKAFLGRLAKPVYDVLKVLVLNRNRQRGYIEAVMFHDWAALSQEARIVDMTLKNDERFGPQFPPHFSLYILYITIELMDHYVALGLELKLFCGDHELAVAYWYRDFLLSALINQLTSMRQTKAQFKLAQQGTQTNAKRGKKKGGKNNKKHGGNQGQDSTPEDIEDEFDFLAVNLKRILCRGTVRFLASFNQAGMIPEKDFEFTSKERIFQKRFEAFEPIQQPPSLQYADYVTGSDFSDVPQNDLLASTAECFNAAKVYVDKLISQVQVIQTDYVAMQEDELRRLAKVCIGNSIYLQKLRQMADSASCKADGNLSFDMETHDQFCTIKII